MTRYLYLVWKEGETIKAIADRGHTSFAQFHKAQETYPGRTVFATNITAAKRIALRDWAEEEKER